MGRIRRIFLHLLPWAFNSANGEAVLTFGMSIVVMPSAAPSPGDRQRLRAPLRTTDASEPLTVIERRLQDSPNAATNETGSNSNATSALAKEVNATATEAPTVEGNSSTTEAPTGAEITAATEASTGTRNATATEAPTAGAGNATATEAPTVAGNSTATESPTEAPTGAGNEAAAPPAEAEGGGWGSSSPPPPLGGAAADYSDDDYAWSGPTSPPATSEPSGFLARTEKALEGASTALASQANATIAHLCPDCDVKNPGLAAAIAACVVAGIVVAALRCCPCPSKKKAKAARPEEAGVPDEPPIPAAYPPPPPLAPMPMPPPPRLPGQGSDPSIAAINLGSAGGSTTRSHVDPFLQDWSDDDDDDDDDDDWHCEPPTAPSRATRRDSVSSISTSSSFFTRRGSLHGHFGDWGRGGGGIGPVDLLDGAEIVD